MHRVKHEKLKYKETLLETMENTYSYSEKFSKAQYAHLFLAMNEKVVQILFYHQRSVYFLFSTRSEIIMFVTTNSKL